MKTHIMTSLRMAAVTIVLTGLAYPLLVTGIAQLTMPHRADGSLVARDGKVVGSALIGQAFAGPRLPAAAPLGRRRRVRRDGLGRLEPGPDLAQAARPRDGGRRPPAGRESRRRRARCRSNW